MVVVNQILDMVVLALLCKKPYNINWIYHCIPILGITTNIGAEIFAMYYALKLIHNHYQQHYKYNRIIILSDCKFVINCINNKWNPSEYTAAIYKCQKND